jgi:hypothetical protein
LGLLIGREVIRKLAIGVVTIMTRDRTVEVPSEGIGLLVRLNILAFSRIRGDGLSRSMMTPIGTKRGRRALKSYRWPDPLSRGGSRSSSIR